MSTLRDKTVSGISWSFIQKIGANGISILVMVLLARLLSSKDFGLMGMLMIFIQLSQALIDGGFNAALIQKKDTDDEDYSSVFYINLMVSIILYSIIFFVSPFIARFYDQPKLTTLARVLSLNFIINAFSYVQEARLMKEIRFKTLTLVHIPSTVVGGVVGIVMALAGFGVWSLVGMQLATRVTYSGQMWIYAKWKPLILFNPQRVKKLFSFGSRLMISDIITSLYNNVYIVIIGKFFPVNVLGYYQNAYSTSNAPSGIVASVLRSVTFPVFSSIQDEDERLKYGYKKVMQQAFFWMCPMYILAALLAKPLFLFIFTSKWLPSVPYFQILCVVAALQPLEQYNLNIVNVKGRSDVWLKLQLARRFVTIVAIILVIPYGVIPLLCVQAGSAIFTYAFFGHFAGRFIDYQLKEQIIDILPVFIASCFVGVCGFILDHFISGIALIFRLILDFMIAGALYWAIVRTLRFSPYVDFVNIFQKIVWTRFNRGLANLE